VVVSCGAINSAALLLRSANDKHPQGLANSSDVVGRHYMGHTNSVLMAISRCPNPTIFQKTLSVNDFYFGSRDFEYPMGHISFVGKLDAITLRAGAPAIAPGFTLELMAQHSLDFWLTSEDLPDPDKSRNHRPQRRDCDGLYAEQPEGSRSAKSPSSENHEAEHLLSSRSGVPPRLFSRNLYVGQRIPLAGSLIQNGTIRFGHDAKTSALDVNCKTHDVDNLYVVDGSFFPSSAAVNPALTISRTPSRGGPLAPAYGRDGRRYEANKNVTPEVEVVTGRDMNVKRHFLVSADQRLHLDCCSLPPWQVRNSHCSIA